MSSLHSFMRILPPSRAARCTLDLRLQAIVLADGSPEEKTMEIKRNGSRPSLKGPTENFIGSVRIDPLFDPPVPARTFGALVTFEPGARTAWHRIRSGRP